MPTNKPLVRTNTLTGSTNRCRGKIKKGKEEAPIFLRKTYAMISTCDPSYACWSDNGETFLVKNPEVFARDIIPQFFKHNKFASFVRQLNFYGFRKIKNESILVSDETAPHTPEYKYWKFRHEKFLRGRPDLLVEIRKLGQNQTVVDPEEVAVLKDQVRGLQKEVGSLKRTMEEMVGFFKVVTEQQQKQASVYSGTPPMKRMKLSKVSPDLVSSTNLALPPSFPFSLPTTHPSTLQSQSRPLHDAAPDNVSSQEQQVEPTPLQNLPQLPTQLHRSDSVASNASNFTLDQQLLNEFLTAPIGDGNSLEDEFALLADIESKGNANLNKISQSTHSNSQNSQSSQNCFGLPPIASPDSVLDVDQKLRNRLNHALNYFPKDMQNTLIERLIDGVSDAQLMKPLLGTDTTTSSGGAGDAEENKNTPPTTTAVQLSPIKKEKDA